MHNTHAMHHGVRPTASVAPQLGLQRVDQIHSELSKELLLAEVPGGCFGGGGCDTWVTFDPLLVDSTAVVGV